MSTNSLTISVLSQPSESRKEAVALSESRSVQFLSAVYIHMMMFTITAVFSRNLVSTAIRAVVLPLIR